MAAILEKLLSKELTPEQLIHWLKALDHKNEPSPPVIGQEIARCEFVPYFLNYLRDQSSHLLQNSKSASTTPAKTPTTAKLRRLTTFSVSQGNDSSIQNGRRQQLFCATSESKDKTFNEKTSSGSDPACARLSSGTRKQFKNKARDGSGKSQRSIQFTDTMHKSKHKTSLGDFLKCPDVDSKLKMSPASARWDNTLSGGQHGKKNVTKHRSGEKKQKFTSESNTLDPAFSLSNENEFPPMNVEDRCNSIPDGVTVITPSRRIVPTRLGTSSKTKDNHLFKNAPVSATGFSKTRGVWGQVATRDFSQQKTPTEKELPNKPHRRIAPTLISSKITASSDSNVFSMPATSNPWRGSPKENGDGIEATLSKEERPAVINQPDTADNEEAKPVMDLSFMTPTKPSLEQQVSVDTVVAEKDQVTHQETLDLMIRVYSFCIKAFLVPNIAVELYFLAQLLTVHGTEIEKDGNFINRDFDEVQYFISVHNAVYFSVMVLASITSILSHLDRGTLHLLADNQRITDFKPELGDELRQLYNLVPSKTLPKLLPSPVGGVSFQADTDNRKNFPNERSFHLFKKQRDMFYELIREWEDNHLTAGWSMQEIQGERIQNLVGFKTELANHIHFVRLFQSQLIQMCKGDSSWEKDEEDENSALLSELKQTNPKKLKRLRERLVTPALHGGPCPAPSFPGCQEFFKDFISAACNPIFNQLLSDQLLHKISEVNEVQFISMDVTYDDDEEIMVDTGDSEALLNCILTSKLLAKFLGFVAFLPYNTPEVLPEGLLASYIDMREKSSQPVDIRHYILEAYQQGRTVITVPWTVEYISMIDPVASQLTYFQEVFSIFVNIYRDTSEQFKLHSTSSHLLVLTVLGWLFELPWFPEGQVFTESYQTVSKEIPRFALDKLNIVDQHILYSCCPYLGEVKNVLVDFAVGVSGRCSSVRKITPVTADSLLDICTTTVTDKQLQHQLEDNFFHNQPTSLKKTIEFVADRVSSNHIKIYRTRILPQVFTEAQQHVQQIAEDIVSLQTESTASGQKEIQQSVENRASELAKKAKALCMESAPRFCSERCRDVLSLLLPEEMPEQVWKIAALISYRQALDKVNSWLNMQITTHMFKKELLVTSDLEKKVRYLAKKNLDEISDSVHPGHNLSADTPALNQSDGGLNNNWPPVVSAGCNSLMFESPIRALQQVTSGSKISTTDSSMSHLFQPTLTNQLTSSSPVSKCIRNLSSFDKEPSHNLDVSIKILSARLSEVETGDSLRSNRCLSGVTGILLNSDSLLNSSHLMRRQQDASVKHVTGTKHLMKENKPVPSLLIETSIIDKVTESGNDLPIKCSEEAVLQNDATVCQQYQSEDVTQTINIINLNNVSIIPDNDLSRGTDSPGSSTNKLASLDFDSLNKTDNSSSTSSILHKVGASGKKLNVSFYGDTTTSEDLDGILFIHSTPQTSPTKAISTTQSVRDNTADNTDSCTITSPTEILISLKECVRCLIQEPYLVTASHICDILNNMTAVFDKADNQVVSLVSKMMAKLSVDLAFIIALQQPQMMTSAVQEAFFMFWQISDVKKCLDFSQILCFKHLCHLQEGNQTYTCFVKSILDRGWLSISLLASNANQLLDTEYITPDTINVLSRFMCDLLPLLREDSLLSPTLHVLIARLASSDKNVTRKQSLMTVLEKTTGATFCLDHSTR